MKDNRDKFFQDITNRFSKKYEEYRDDFGAYIEGTDLGDQLKQLSNYVDHLSKLSTEQRNLTIQAGIAYAKEKIEAYRTGNAEVIIFFHHFYKYPQKKAFQNAVEPKDFEKFWNNPGVPAIQTKEAHDLWWDLMLFKHQIVGDFFGSITTDYSLNKISTNKNRKPHNYKGRLCVDCIKDLERLAKEKPRLAINKFFEAAHTQFDSCRKAIKEIDNGKKETKISWSKLRDEVKRMGRDDIYYRDIKRGK